jgi:hypothetical protein
LILLKILKLFGLDVPAKIEAVKASLELRLEQATDHVKQVAQEAALIAGFSAIAAATAAMAAGVGLIALYRWTADTYGPYSGLGVVAAVLAVVTIIFATAAIAKGKSLAANRIKLPRHPTGPANVTSDPAASAVDTAAEPVSSRYSSPTPTGATPAAPTASASDLVEPLAFFLSKFIKYPRVDNPAVDELIGNLRATAHSTADEAIARASDVIRHGDRTNLVVVLGGAVLAGWLLTRHSRELSPTP